MAPTKLGPTHLKAQPGDDRSLCGVKKPLPVCTVAAAPRHRYAHERCLACFTAAGLTDLLDQGVLL